MTRVHRLLLPITLAGLLLGILAPSASAASLRFPVQSLGDRGTDVKAIQWLLNDRGFPVTADGVFGTLTADAVNAFKATVSLVPNGIVGEGTWKALIRPLRIGDSGPAVKALQRQLRAKRHLAVPVDGVFGPSTRAAVRTFQAHAGRQVTGEVTRSTWRRLIAHYELPTFNGTSLCDYSVGNGAANWGTAAAINQVEAAAKVVASKGYGRVAIGDVSREHGGNIALHSTHKVGLDVDLRPMRRANDQCRWGVNWRWSTYDRKATRALIKAIRAAAPGHVKLIYFNDPVMIRAGLTRWFPGHDDHLHVRYCEQTHPLARYDC
jgi:peptidoglycan hydrolase-like protein with peptidoglycan-binding domain